MVKKSTFGLQKGCGRSGSEFNVILKITGNFFSSFWNFLRKFLTNFVKNFLRNFFEISENFDTLCWEEFPTFFKGVNSSQQRVYARTAFAVQGLAVFWPQNGAKKPPGGGATLVF